MWIKNNYVTCRTCPIRLQLRIFYITKHSSFCKRIFLKASSSSVHHSSLFIFTLQASTFILQILVGTASFHLYFICFILQILDFASICKILHSFNLTTRNRSSSRIITSNHHIVLTERVQKRGSIPRGRVIPVLPLCHDLNLVSSLLPYLLILDSWCRLRHFISARLELVRVWRLNV